MADTLGSIRGRFLESITHHPEEINTLLLWIESQGKGLLKPHQLLAEFENIFKGTGLKQIKGGLVDILRCTQEAIVLLPWVALAVRPSPGVWEYIRVNLNGVLVEELSVPEYLQFKEVLVDGNSNGDLVLELDFEPFNAELVMVLSSSIGIFLQNCSMTRRAQTHYLIFSELIIIMSR